jgi:hypothetical protein
MPLLESGAISITALAAYGECCRSAKAAPNWVNARDICGVCQIVPGSIWACAPMAKYPSRQAQISSALLGPEEALLHRGRFVVMLIRILHFFFSLGGCVLI